MEKTIQHLLGCVQKFLDGGIQDLLLEITVLKIGWKQAVLTFFCFEIDVGSGLSCAEVCSNNVFFFGDQAFKQLNLDKCLLQLQSCSTISWGRWRAQGLFLENYC